jgi:hypothetical protein
MENRGARGLVIFSTQGFIWDFELEVFEPEMLLCNYGKKQSHNSSATQHRSYHVGNLQAMHACIRSVIIS